VRIIWSEIAQATFVRFMADQAGMMAVNRAVKALADDPAPLGAFVRGAYRRLRVGPYRVLYEVEGNLFTAGLPFGLLCRDTLRCLIRPR
jgi:hypothetical protein